MATLNVAAFGTPVFSPDGRWLATTPGGVQVWRVGDWQLAADLHAQGNAQQVSVAFSPDSRLLAVGQPTGTIRLTDPATGSSWAELTDPERSPCSFLAITSDQSRLITIARRDRGAARIWNLARFRQELARRGLDWPADIMRPKPAESPRPLSITLDAGDLHQREQSMDLLREAGTVSTIKVKDLFERASCSIPRVRWPTTNWPGSWRPARPSCANRYGRCGTPERPASWSRATAIA